MTRFLTQPGGTILGAHNLISGNTWNGVLLKGKSAIGNQVLNNFIGTTADGTASLNNRIGVLISEGASSNLIGDTGSGEANTIAYNSFSAVSLLPAPTCPAGTACEATGNKIRGNSIFSNGSLGIDLGNNGVSLNDAGDVDTGSNNLQNFPVLNSFTNTAGNLTISGTLARVCTF